MNVKLFHYIKEAAARPMATDMLVVPFGSNARSLALLAPVSEWIRNDLVYTRLLSSDAIVKKSATYSDHTKVANITYFIKHISGSSIYDLVTNCLEFALQNHCTMIDMPLFTANGFKATTDEVSIMKSMLKACNDFIKKQKDTAASMEISFILDNTQLAVAKYCIDKGIQYSGLRTPKSFER